MDAETKKLAEQMQALGLTVTNSHDDIYVIQLDDSRVAIEGNHRMAKVLNLALECYEKGKSGPLY